MERVPVTPLSAIDVFGDRDQGPPRSLAARSRRRLPHPALAEGRRGQPGTQPDVAADGLRRPQLNACVGSTPFGRGSYWRVPWRLVRRRRSVGAVGVCDDRHRGPGKRAMTSSWHGLTARASRPGDRAWSLEHRQRSGAKRPSSSTKPPWHRDRRGPPTCANHPPTRT